MTGLDGEPERPDALDEELEGLAEADLIDPLDERLPAPGQPPDPRAAGHHDPDDQQQDDEEEPRPVFAAVQFWVEEIFAKTYIRDYLDRLLPPLMSSRGPFAACRPEQHMDQEPLPTAPAPALPPRGRPWTPPALGSTWPRPPRRGPAHRVKSGAEEDSYSRWRWR